MVRHDYVLLCLNVQRIRLFEYCFAESRLSIEMKKKKKKPKPFMTPRGTVFDDNNYDVLMRRHNYIVDATATVHFNTDGFRFRFKLYE